jgi:sortase A
MFWVSAGCVVLGLACIGLASLNIWAGAPKAPAFRVVSSDPSTQTVLTSVPITDAVAPAAAPKKQRAPRKVTFSKDPSAGDTLGRLTIPALKQEFLVIEGTRNSDLKKGVGHYVKSVMPGQKDNCVLSAHRDTFFSKLGELKKGDRMTLETATGSYTYEVKRTRIVGKDDRTVIVPTKHGVLTLTTCYPFDYVGSAPKRYIVSADLVP